MATILKFISRGERLRLRGLRNFAQWNRIRLGLEPFGPRERSHLFHQQAEDEAKDRSWAQRHAPIKGGAVVLWFPPGPDSDFLAEALTWRAAHQERETRHKPPAVVDTRA